MSIDNLKAQCIKTFETEGSYIHRDHLDELFKVIKDILDRLSVLEAK